MRVMVLLQHRLRFGTPTRTSYASPALNSTNLPPEQASARFRAAGWGKIKENWGTLERGFQKLLAFGQILAGLSILTIANLLRIIILEK
jgi:hypothetical protein